MSETAAPNGAAGGEGGQVFRPADPPPRERGLTASEGLEALRRARQQNGVATPTTPTPEPTAADPAPRPPPAAHDGGEDDGGQVGDIEILVDGRPQRVTMAELTQGYLRQADYTKKTQGIGQKQSELQQVFEAFSQARDQYQSRLDRYVTETAQEFDKPVDWVTLARENPLGWQEKRARYEMLQEAKREQAELQQQRALEEENRRVNLVQAGHAMLVQAIPGWKDTSTRQQLQDEMRNYAKQVGYTDAELNQGIVDPRQILVLHDAAQGRKLREQKVTPRPSDPGRGVPRGSAPATQPTRRERDARSVFDNAPTMRNAMRLAQTLRELKPAGRR